MFMKQFKKSTHIILGFWLNLTWNRVYGEKRLTNSTLWRVLFKASQKGAYRKQNNNDVTLKDIITPKYFDSIAFTVRESSGYDPINKSFNAFSLAMHFGTYLKTVCDDLYHLILKEAKAFKCETGIDLKMRLQDIKCF